MDSRKEPDWEELAGRLLHPTQMAIVEALSWVQRPLSPVQLARLFDNGMRLPSIAYHVRRLAHLGVIKQTETRPVRGAIEHFFRLAV